MSNELMQKIINNFGGKELSQLGQLLGLINTYGVEVDAKIFDILGTAIDYQVQLRPATTGQAKTQLEVVGACAECGGNIVRWNCQRIECYDCGLVVRGPQ